MIDLNAAISYVLSASTLSNCKHRLDAAVREIYLIRHGETEWNASGRFQGQPDSPLNERGKAQAAACGQWLSTLGIEFDAVLASPLGMTRQTASIIASFGQFPERQFDERLAVVLVGAWDGLTHMDIDAQ